MDINKAVDWAIGIANDNTHGYSQSNRMGPDYDCSSLVGHALNYGGFNVSKSSTTRNLFAQLKVNGFVTCSKPWKKGDIHLKEGHHVVMSIDENRIVHASINENGKTTGGKTGDQTGKEICIRSYYDYKGGWDYHLRYVGVENKNVNKNAVFDGWTQRLQKLIGADPDGIKGPETLGKCPLLAKGSRGDVVKLVQERLNSVGFHLDCDGIFGNKTYNAVMVFQKNRGLQVDGIVGKNTWKWLLAGTKM